MRCRPILACLVALAAMVSTTCFAQLRSEGWWVVVASFPEEDTERMAADFDLINAEAFRCGFSTFNDFSGKFVGFRPGFNVFVIGAYEAKTDAERTRELVDSCLPGAYVKQGRYLGE